VDYVLDTHALIWSLFDSKKLSKKVKAIILNPENNIYVSIISFWEISLKYNLGKISFKDVNPEELPGYVENSGFEILALEADVVASFHRLPVDGHKDPFDRLIVWQCIHHKFTLLSKDEQFHKYSKHALNVAW